MTYAHTIYKVPQGKLLKISLDYEPQSNIIHHVNITGDFFIHPEDGLDLLEQSLRHSSFSHDAILRTLKDTVTAHHLNLIGITPEAITEAIMRCRS